MNEGVVLGVDVGSSAVKVTAFDENWVPVAQARRAYSEIRGERGEIELSVAKVIARAHAAISQCCVEVRAVSEKPILAISIACLGEALVPVDHAGMALAKAMLTGDARMGGAAAWWESRFDLASLHQLTGLPMRDIWSANIVRHHIATLGRKKIGKFLTIEDLLVASLGGTPRTARSLASRSMMVDHRSGEWAPRVLELLGIDEGNLPNIADPGTVLGVVPRKGDMPLPAGVSIVSGGHDQFCAAIGSGASATMPMWSTGTVDSFTMLTTERPRSSPKADVDQLPHCQVDKNLYVRSIPNLNAGRALNWLVGILGIEDVGALIDESDPPERLLVVPTLGVTGAPDYDSNQTARIYGLSYADGRASLAAAMVEGIVLETRHAVVNSGVELSGFSGITVAGGASQSRRWMQLKAEAFGLPVICRRFFDAGCVGTAIFARQAIDGVRPEVDRVNPVVSESLPSTEGTGRLDRQSTRYARLRANGSDTVRDNEAACAAQRWTAKAT